MTDNSRLLGISQPAVGYAVDRGERIVRKSGINLVK